MADFGMGPYAWLRSPDELSPRVGGNIADSLCGFPEEYAVSKELEVALAEWAINFEKHSEDVSFDWEAWNQRGLQLSKLLKREVGERFRVEYHYPHEDPRFEEGPPVLNIDEL